MIQSWDFFNSDFLFISFSKLYAATVECIIKSVVKTANILTLLKYHEYSNQLLKTYLLENIYVIIRKIIYFLSIFATKSINDKKK